MDAREFQEELEGLEKRLERLRAKYELYFQGMERVEPRREREMVERGMRTLLRHVPNNTSLKFRFNTFKQRLVTFKTYWGRIGRQIEEGTYKRHVQRAKKRFAPKQPVRSDSERPKQQAFELNLDDDLDVDQLFAGVMEERSAPRKEFPRTDRSRTPGALPAVPRRPVRANEGGAIPKTEGRPRDLARAAKKMKESLPPPRPPKRPPSPGSRERPEQYRAVFDAYLDARRKNNQKVDHLQYDSVAKKLDKMLPALKKKHQGNDFDFKVVVHKGKVGIKPIAKKS